ncbi:MAG: cation:proton antiporter [Bacteroidales bacterium]|nr:cation:proton antiporter [Bacteroidales bacterium]
MSTSAIVIILGLLVVFSHVFSALFEKTRIPNVLILMLIGVVVGPVLGLVGPDGLGKMGSVFTTITLVVILFQSGTALDLMVMRKAFGKAMLVTVLNFVISVGAGIAAGRLLLGLDWMHGIFLGAALGGTSSAVVIPMVNQLRLGERAGTILSLESAFSDILCLVLALAMMGGIYGDEVSVRGICLDMATSMILAVAIGLASGALWTIVLKKYLTHLSNMMFTTLALAFILYGLCDIMNINGGLAVLAFGLAFAHTGVTAGERRISLNYPGLPDNEKNFYAEMVFIFQTFFFVYIGISIQPGNLTTMAYGLAFVALVYLGRYLTSLLLSREKNSRRDIIMAWAVGPKGLVAAVLATLPLQYVKAHAVAESVSGREEELLKAAETVRDFACTVVLISIIVSSLLVMILDRKKR